MVEVEMLDYIKETAVEMKELQDKVIELTNANKDAEVENEKLKGLLSKRDCQINNLSELCNKWHSEYSNVYTKYKNLENQCDFISLALAKVCNKLKEKIDEDVADEFFSDIFNDFGRSRY